MFGETQSKKISITKKMVWDAYKRVKSNKGSEGVDGQSLEEFQSNEINNLYQLWNRLSSGSYHPKPVLSVKIPKSGGGHRELGIPTITDRIAQQVVRNYLEPRLEEIFHKNSFGYRPKKSAHQALEVVKVNVDKYGWVLDVDIKSFFDEVDHELLMKIIERHVPEKWARQYIQRWLQSPILKEGVLKSKEGKGTPQGGVISPLLSNLYLHYAFDVWMNNKFPQLPFIRYADDIIVHCQTEKQADYIMVSLRRRLQECRLKLNEEKSKIVSCRPKQSHENNKKRSFDFLGFTFKPRLLKSKLKGLFIWMDFGISKKSVSRIMTKWSREGTFKNTSITIQDIANKLNPEMIGIIRYYGKIKQWTLLGLMRKFHQRLVVWILKKFKKFKGSRERAYKWLNMVKASYPNMFYHWTVFPKM